MGKKRSVCPAAARTSSKNARPEKKSGTGGLRGTSYSLNGLPSDLGHDGTFSPKVFIAQAQEIVDDQGCEKSVQSKPLTSTGWVNRWRNSKVQQK